MQNEKNRIGTAKEITAKKNNEMKIKWKYKRKYLQV